jgi:hypothetical protein
MGIITDNGRLLRHNRSGELPTRHLYLDVESKLRKHGRYTLHRFWLGWTCFIRQTNTQRVLQEDWQLWESKEALCRYIDRKAEAKLSLMIYGHNLYYDLQVGGFFEYFHRWGWKLEFVYDSGMSFILIIKKDIRTIKCVSTTNYFDYSLRTLGEHLGEYKLDVHILKATRQELIPYCRQDVSILVSAMRQYMQFCREHDTGKFALTRASQAMACYRHRFMDRGIYIHTMPEAIQLERDGYFGGRTEAFWWGKLPGQGYTFLDVHSMYPFVMHDYRYPCKLVYFDTDPPLDTLRKHLPYLCAMADVTLETQEPIYALRTPDHILFPVGRFRTVLATGALKLALSRGEILHVHRLALYESAYLFKSYVDYFYPLKAQYKEQGNKIYTAIVKLFLNALYGKFGQSKPITEEIDYPALGAPYRICNIAPESRVHWTEYGLFGKIVREYGQENTSNTFVAIAAHVTEYARLVLWEYITKLGCERVFYCDTDSLLVQNATLLSAQNLLSPSRLGALGIDKTADTVRLYGAKDYELDGHRYCKGIPKSATLLGPHTYQFEQFLSSRTHMRLSETTGFLSEPHVKIVNPDYLKGYALAGGPCLPYCFG